MIAHSNYNANKKVLTSANMNPKVRAAEYAVRGELAIKSEKFKNVCGFPTDALYRAPVVFVEHEMRKVISDEPRHFSNRHPVSSHFSCSRTLPEEDLSHSNV